MLANQKKLSWHSVGVAQIFEEIGARLHGLSSEEAEKRLKKFGPNKLAEEKQLSDLVLFLSQLKSPLVFILIIAGVVTFALGDYTDTVIIFVAVFLNTTVGYYQEKKASGALSSLKKVLRAKAVVLRDKTEKEISQEEVVPGDIVFLRIGDKVPADARIIEARDLKINESALTGEWLEASKEEKILKGEVPLVDRENMSYMGTSIENGWGKAVVVNTGTKTEVGNVSLVLSSINEEQTPYQKKLGAFSRLVGVFVIILSLAIFIEGMITGGEFVEMFTTSIAVAVAAIPEGLPVAMTVILALGMQRILKRKGLVRRLVSAETLGSTSVILTDKTGTLTEAKMEVAGVYDGFKNIPLESGSLRLYALKIAALCSESFIENPEAPTEEWIVRGRPTDKALLVSALHSGMEKNSLLKDEETLDFLPFNSRNKYSASLNRVSERKNFLYVMGAPEILVSMSAFIKEDDGEKKLNTPGLEKLKNTQRDLAGQGIRVLAVAYKEINKKLENGARIIEEGLDNLVFSGFIALHDPIRPDTQSSIESCREAGMRPIIVTGDHRLTAKAVAEKLGFGVARENILEGKELEAMSQDDFEKRLEEIQIYARVDPSHKLRIVRAWQKRGEVVAMTGDGINDALALKQADVGVALGSGTDVAKEVSDLVLLNNSFSVIVAAVEEGRVIIDNIRKVITYLLSDGFTEVILVGTSLLFGLPLPVLAGQILWVNLIADGLPNAALAFEKKEKGLLKQKPQKLNAPLLTKEMKFLIFIIGIFTDLFLLGVFFYLLKYTDYEIARVRSVVFAGLAISSLFYVFSCKSLKQNIWRTNLFSNKFLLVAWGAGVLALFAALYLPFLQTLLQTVPLGLFDWAILVGLGFANIVCIEAAKMYFIVKKQAV